MNEIADALLASLRRRPQSPADLAKRLKTTRRQLDAAARDLRDRGYLLTRGRQVWQLEKSPEPGGPKTPHTFRSDDNGQYVFGFTSDNHLCSKYERLDVLAELYDRFADSGVERVYNAGNWIDGEASFNRYDIHTHGLDAQLDYLAEHYPSRPGVHTYAIAGEDHEGWYGRREGVDIGRAAALAMQHHGREDWTHLGFMEAYVELKHAKTGRASQMLVIHPGGGSAYAVSYRPQKIVEALEGGEKPAVLLIGHYHKKSYNEFRNVHCIQTGCTQDQTPFMRKKGLQAHVGGGICWLTQDAATGAITDCTIRFFNYFNRGYYNGRWSQSGRVVLPRRK